MLFLIHFALALILVLTTNILGVLSKDMGYVSIESVLRHTNFKYNFLVRVLTPAMFICLISIAALALNSPYLVKNIYLVAVYYCSINLFILVILNRLQLVNKFMLLTVYVFTIATAYVIYALAISKGLKFILPEAGNFRTEFWFIVLIYFYNLLNNFGPDYGGEQSRKTAYHIKRYKKLKSKYAQNLGSEILDDGVLEKTFFSIMVYEDLNRPPVVRTLERLASTFGLASTTGIMQVWSEKTLSDKESIELAQKRILEVSSKLRASAVPESRLPLEIAEDYNGAEYSNKVSETYSDLSSDHRRNWMRYS